MMEAFEQSDVTVDDQAYPDGGVEALVVKPSARGVFPLPCVADWRDAPIEGIYPRHAAACNRRLAEAISSLNALATARAGHRLARCTAATAPTGLQRAPGARPGGGDPRLGSSSFWA